MIIRAIAVFVFLQATIVSSKLSILSPQSLSQKFNRKEGIDFRVGEFGKLPYGAHLVGKLLLASPIDACQSLEPFAQGENLGTENIIAVVTRGGCRDGTKLLNVQQAGAKMMLLINEDDDMPDSLTNPQAYRDVNVPTVLISKKDGTKIIEYLKSSNENPETAIVSMVFPQNMRKSEVNIELWFSSADTFRTAFTFLDQLKKILADQEHAFIFTPHYVTWTCGRCRSQGFNVADSPDCISGGRYCAPDPDDEGPLNGREIVREDLRQICIWKTSPSLWWNYIKRYESECLSQANLEDCSRRILESSRAFETRTCFDTSFKKVEGNTGAVDQYLDENSILQEEKELQLEYEVTTFPALYINGKQYHGRLANINDIYKSMCKELDQPNPKCQQILSSDTGVKSNSFVRDALIMFAIVTLCAILVFYCYRRTGKSESQKMSAEANNMVFNYFALQDKPLKEEETQ